MAKRKKPAASKKTKAERVAEAQAQNAQTLDRLWGEFDALVRRDTQHAIEKGRKLIQIRKLYKHGRWEKELEARHIAVRSTRDWIAAAEFANRVSNSATVTDLSHIDPGVLYQLRPGAFGDRIEAEIVRQAKAGIHVDQDRFEEIQRLCAPKQPYESEAAESESKTEQSSTPTPTPTPGPRPANLDPLVDQINAKLAAAGDPRHVTWLDAPFLGLTYALEGGPEGTIGGMEHDDLVRLAEELEKPSAPVPPAPPATPSAETPAPEPMPGAAAAADSGGAAAASPVSGETELTGERGFAAAKQQADLEAAIVSLNKLVSKPLGTFATIKVDKDTIARVANFLTNLVRPKYLPVDQLFGEAVARLDKLTDTPPTEFDRSKIGTEALRRVADFLIDVANRKRQPAFEPPKRKPVTTSSATDDAETPESSAEHMKRAHAAAEHKSDPPAKMRWKRTAVGDRDMWRSGGREGGNTYWINKSDDDVFDVLFAETNQFDATASIVPSDIEKLKTLDDAKTLAVDHRNKMLDRLASRAMSAGMRALKKVGKGKQ